MHYNEVTVRWGPNASPFFCYECRKLMSDLVNSSTIIMIFNKMRDTW